MTVLLTAYGVSSALAKRTRVAVATRSRGASERWKNAVRVGDGAVGQRPAARATGRPTPSRSEPVEAPLEGADDAVGVDRGEPSLPGGEERGDHAGARRLLAESRVRTPRRSREQPGGVADGGRRSAVRRAGPAPATGMEIAGCPVRLKSCVSRSITARTGSGASPGATTTSRSSPIAGATMGSVGRTSASHVSRMRSTAGAVASAHAPAPRGSRRQDGPPV